MTNLSGMDIIEVIVPGRCSGQSRSALLSSLPTEHGWLIAASNLGSDHHPNWWLNLVDAGMSGTARAANDRRVEVRAVELQGDARRQAWDRLVGAQEMYKGYEAATRRVIPVIELRIAASR